MKNPKYMFCT